MRCTTRIIKPIGAALALGALAAPSALAQGQVTPDARDAAMGIHPGSAPAPQVVVKESHRDSIDVGDLAIGAGGAFGLVLIATGGALAVTRRRRPTGVA